VESNKYVTINPVVELRGYIDEKENKLFGHGYRIYFAKDGEDVVILIGGGTKKRQSKDIQAAQACWADYKRRKKQETQ
jgi:putative addiction module killer protein